MRQLFSIIALLTILVVPVFSQNYAAGTSAGNSGTNNTSVGSLAGDNVTGASNSFFGYKAGAATTSGGQNVMLGWGAGFSTTTGNMNTYLGKQAGYGNTTGSSNVYIGAHAGYFAEGSNELWIDNTASSTPLIFGNFNTNQVGINTTTPGYTLNVGGTLNANNIFMNGQPLSAMAVPGQWVTTTPDIYFNVGKVGIGTATPNNMLDVTGKIGAGSLFVSGNVGVGVTTPIHKLDVDGTINASAIYINGAPFVGGGSQWASVGPNINYNGAGVVSIGTTLTPTGYKLAIGGKMIAEEVLIKMRQGGSGWPDYVFETNYKLQTLEEVQRFIKDNKHLPDVPSAKEVEANGVAVGEMNAILLKKVEELTLHLIEMNERLNRQEKLIEDLSKKN